MLARWFDRNGIGQILAPDEKAAKSRQNADLEEASAPFWQFVAPDEKFSKPKVPPKSAFLHPINGNQVLCMHCHRWTDIANSPVKTESDNHNNTQTETAAVKTPHSVAAPEDPRNMFTPEDPRNMFTPDRTPKLRYPSSSTDNLSDLVLSAAKETAVSMTSPPQILEARDKVLRLCASSKPINEKLAKRLRNILKKNPVLIRKRATHMGQLVPDGFTPLMATAYANHTVACQIVLEMGGSIWDRDLQGRTPLHIAAELGHLDIIELLLPKYQGDAPDNASFSAPIDILGRTPLGRAVTSPNPTAKKRQKELQNALFSPNDLSVFGHAKPESERTSQNSNLKIAYGMADMPGMRVTMEDAVCCNFFEQQGKSYCLLMVCDGHGDRGLVSQFVCDTLPDILQNNMKDEEATWETKWQRSCLEVDSQLKETNIIGGSTAVMALISEGSIVVANVGDSRAILVQSSSSSSTTRLETNKEQLTVSPTKEENTKEGEEKPSTNNTPIVVAMSEDHKPNLERELTRIVNAGMTMREIIFEENGEEFTIHKIAKNDKEQLAVSRSFGDFEYKLNTTLAPEEQAVTAVPDVRIHVRDSATDMYLILACDGVFDVMKNEQVMKFCLDQVSMRCEMSTDTVLPEVGDSLLRECLNCGSKDNMTTIIAALGNESTKIKPVIQGRTLFNE